MSDNKKEYGKRIRNCLLILVFIALVLGTVFSLLAPYGSDLPREKQTRVFDSKLNESDTDGIFLPVEDESSLVFEKNFSVTKDGVWNIYAGYIVVDNSSQEPEFEILVDGCSLSDSAITLTKAWSDLGEFKKTLAGDEIRPLQQQVSVWQEEPFRIGKKEKAAISLTAGEHTIKVVSLSGECAIKYLKVLEETTVTYEAYINQHKDAVIIEDSFIEIEAETPYLKSSSELNALYDRSSPFTLPYHATCIRYNTIGGNNWKENGQWIEWQVEVPKTGMYRLGMRARQNENKGQDSLRKLSIDGKVPFEEVKTIPFKYDVNWDSDFIGNNNEPFLFYLTEGTHIIRLEVTLGEKEEMAYMMQKTLTRINELYREIIMITGTQPDIYRDYSLETAIPDLEVTLSEIIQELSSYKNWLEENYGEGAYSARIITQVLTQLNDFEKKPYTIAKRLSVFKTNIAAFAEWILEFEEQPLQIDYLYLAGSNNEIPEAEGNAFSKAGHEIRAFVGSFSHSYNEVTSEGAEDSDVTLTVWMGRGRDQANVVKRIIDSYFTPETGINVNISLVEGALVKAALAGQGPDVNIFTSRGEAMNLAFRGAIADLSVMDEFNALQKEYMDSAFVPYTYENAVYGIPETQEFYMMYIRTDIFDELGLQIPSTWKDVMALLPILQSNSLAIGLPYTDGYATMGNGIGTINLYPTLLLQKGEDIYQETVEGTRTNLLSSTAYDAFKQWSDFYVQYDFDFYKDDFNRFRTGEMPIIISSYGLYNNLTEAAPEIAGQWTMVKIPGTDNGNGVIDRTTSASGSCSIILKDCENKEAAWKFVEWWNSADTQEMYARDIEAELSTLGRHTPANLKAFEKSMWREEEKELLLSQWKEVVEVPEIPGGYYVSRNIDNALRQVYYNGENPRDTFIYWMNSVDEELARKQAQLEARKENK